MPINTLEWKGNLDTVILETHFRYVDHIRPEAELGIFMTTINSKHLKLNFLIAHSGVEVQV